MTVFRTWGFAVVMMVMQSNFYASQDEQNISSYGTSIKSYSTENSDLESAMNHIIQEGLACLTYQNVESTMDFKKFCSEYDKVSSVFEKYPVEDVIQILQLSLSGIADKESDELSLMQSMIMEYIASSCKKKYEQILEKNHAILRKVELQNMHGYNKKAFNQDDFESIIDEMLANYIAYIKIISGLLRAADLGTQVSHQDFWLDRQAFIDSLRIEINFSGARPQCYWGNAVAILKNKKASQMSHTADKDMYIMSCNALIDLFEIAREFTLGSNFNENYDFLSDILENIEEDVNQISPVTGLTPIHTAVYGLLKRRRGYDRYLQIFDQLIERGADLNIPHCLDGRTPIFTLIEGGFFKGHQVEHEQIVQHMLDYGCNLTIQDEQGMTPYNYACNLAYDSLRLTRAYGIADKIAAKQAWAIADIIGARMGKPSMHDTKFNVNAELLKKYPNLEKPGFEFCIIA